MGMKSAILNSALPAMTAGTESGYWLSITHFALAWVSEEERTANPAVETLTELVRQTPGDNIVRGDYIYNVWQTPFAYKDYSGQFPVPSDLAPELAQGYGKFYQYQYDHECSGVNALIANANTTSQTPPQDVLDYLASAPFLGYSPANPTRSSDLTEANIPVSLDWSGTPIAGMAKYTKFFPIKAYRPIKQEDVLNSTVMNYALNLPPVSSQYGNKESFYANSIGNFKFNRIGLYMTKCSKTTVTNTADPKNVYIPMAQEDPILFAVIDIGVPDQDCTGNDVNFDVYKTRDDSGFAGWEFDAQLVVSTAIVEADPTFYTLYTDAIRDEATKFYQAQMMNNASMAQSIMQLQMMVLQLANRIEEISGVNPFTPYKVVGYDVKGALEMDKEYTLSKSATGKKMLLDALSFRGIKTGGVQYINSANALFNLKKFSSSNKLVDGDFVKITIYNLDGSYETVGGNDVSWWNGSILFANFDEEDENKTKIFEINSELIKGISYAKVTLMFSYTSDAGWVLESQSIIDESSFIS